MLNRRDFVKLSLIGTSTLWGNLKSFSMGSKPAARSLGVQLYSLKDILAKQPMEKILEQLAQYGITYLEGFVADPNMQNSDYKKLANQCSANQMKFISMHCKIYQNPNETIKLFENTGVQYLICPMLPIEKRTIEDYKQIAKKFNEIGKLCKEQGAKFAYHNHHYAFLELEKQIPMNILLDETDPEYVEFQMDIYWVFIAKQDPLAWMKKYKSRFTSCHLKDATNELLTSKYFQIDNYRKSCEMGTGIIDYKSILKESNHNFQYFFIEQDHFSKHEPLDSVKISANYLKSIL